MLVETFEVIESNENEVENRAECVNLINELGLEGQQELMSPDKSDVCPYRKMTDEEDFVYGTICSQVTTMTRYKDGPIPLRVLQVISHAKQFFGEIQIWHCPNADIKDPVAVGIKDGSKFILARWGEVLESLSELKSIAIKMWHSNRMGSLQAAVAKINAHLELEKNLTPEAIAALAKKYRNRSWSDPMHYALELV